MMKLTDEEKKFIKTVKPEVEKFLKTRTPEDVDWGVGSFILSEKGKIYHGVPFPAARTIHGEENAVGTMVTEEGLDATIRIILIVGGGQEPCLPCGMCRVAIYTYATDKTIILCSDIKLENIKKFKIKELYPYPHEGELSSGNENSPESGI